jgi:hypothetical protein
MFPDEVKRMIKRAMLVVLLAAIGGCSGSSDNYGDDQAASVEQIGAPLFGDLGNHQYEISSTNPLSQRYFNQGLNLAYGFNHQEAVRAFKEGARLDPGCAMCYWGQAVNSHSRNRPPARRSSVPS